MTSMHPVTRMDGSGAGRHPGISLWDGASEQSLARALRPPVVYSEVCAVETSNRLI